MKRLAKSNIGYTGIGADGRPVTWYYGWNPFGHGCSAGCDGCWAQRGPGCRMSRCPDCRDFKVHMHPERLCEPANTEKPGVILCNFTNDWLDPERRLRDILVMYGSAVAPAENCHVYVWLTKQAAIAAQVLNAEVRQRQLPCDYFGLTLRDQAEADAKLPTFLAIRGSLWLSLEPLWGPVDLTPYVGRSVGPSHALRPMSGIYIKGVIAGHDNRKGAPGTETLDNIRAVVQQCKAAGVNVYVKQLWQDGMLIDNPEFFPPDLRERTLPWSMP